MNDYLKCDKCTEEDHNGQFCRCENRNIRIAKEMRLRQGSWLQKRFLLTKIENSNA